jgi:hypothetical protein
MDADWRALGEEIAKQRDCGLLHLRVEARQASLTDEEALARLVQQGEFASTPRREIDRPEAERVATLILTRDLAYGSPCIPEVAAHDYLQRFFSAFAANARFFTNGSHDGPRSGLSTWTPLTRATFDTGIFVLDETRVGFLWAEDED